MSRTPVPGEESKHDHGIQQGQQKTFPGTTGDQLEKKVFEIIRLLDMVELDCVEKTPATILPAGSSATHICLIQTE